MKPQINITLVVLRVLVLLITCCLFTLNAVGLDKHSYKGWLLIDGKKIKFSLQFSIANNNLLTGTSLTAQGTKDETKCKIKGRYHPKNKSFLFYETVVISSKAKYENLNFCLLVGNLKRKESSELIKYKVKVAGYIRGTKTICAKGSIYLETPKPKLSKPVRSTKRVSSKADTLFSHIKGKKIIDYKWKDHNAILAISDNIKADGDRVDIYLDGKKIIANYELQERKKTIPLSVGKKYHTIKIVALNEGKASPNTSLITLKGNTSNKRMIAHIKEGEQVYIRLRR